LKVVKGIIAKVEILLDFPNIGSVYKKDEIRIILYGHYRIAYMIDDLSIIILGVFHGAMDIDRYLN
jgi:toxin ParE1/3/4